MVMPPIWPFAEEGLRQDRLAYSLRYGPGYRDRIADDEGRRPAPFLHLQEARPDRGSQQELRGYGPGGIAMSPLWQCGAWGQPVGLRYGEILNGGLYVVIGSETKSLNTSIDVSMAWQESNSHFFPLRFSGFCPPPKFSSGEVHPMLFRLASIRSQERTNSFWVSSSGFSKSRP